MPNFCPQGELFCQYSTLSSLNSTFLVGMCFLVPKFTSDTNTPLRAWSIFAYTSSPPCATSGIRAAYDAPKLILDIVVKQLHLLAMVEIVGLKQCPTGCFSYHPKNRSFMRNGVLSIHPAALGICLLKRTLYKTIRSPPGDSARSLTLQQSKHPIISTMMLLWTSAEYGIFRSCRGNPFAYQFEGFTNRSMGAHLLLAALDEAPHRGDERFAAAGLAPVGRIHVVNTETSPGASGERSLAHLYCISYSYESSLMNI